MKTDHLATCAACSIPCSCNHCWNDTIQLAEWLAVRQTAGDVSSDELLGEARRLGLISTCDGLSGYCANRRADGCPLAK